MISIDEINKLKTENAELKAKIKKYAELNEIDTRDYAALHNENIKLNAIIDGYQPRLQALKVEIAELQAYKDVNEDFKTAWEELKAENERLKEEILKFRWDNPYFDLYNNVVNQRDMWEQKSEQYKQTLQEIKSIVSNIIDGYIRPYGDYEQLKTILDLITKAEEE